jgi:hypothetical protein
MMNTVTTHVLNVGITLSERRERMNNHTLGQWFIQNPPLRSNPDLHIFAEYSEEEQEKYPGSSGEFIASVRRYDVHTQEANARLIAASPELLEACIKAYEALDAILDFREQGLMVQGWHVNGDAEPFDNFINENMDGDEIELLYKAIQKAKGEDRESRT